MDRAVAHQVPSLAAMRISLHQTFDELASCKERWNSLGRNVPFRRWEWLRSWWDHYGDDAGRGTQKRLLILAVWNGQTLIAVAPWYISRVWADGRAIRALGAGEVCSEYVTVLCEVGFEDEVGAALAEWLTENGRRDHHGQESWDLLELGGVVAGDRTVSRLLDHLSDSGNEVYPRAGLSCWRIDLPACWDEYVLRLSKSHRKQVRRAARKLAEKDVQLRHAQTMEEFDIGFAVLLDLHQRRWQSLGQQGCFARPRFLAFHRQAGAELFRSGCVDLAWLELDGRPLAAEYQLLGSDVVYAYQSGIDPTRLALEPGRLAVTAALQRSIEQRRRCYDFLRGDEPYKAHWRAIPRPMWEVRVVPRRAGARLRQGVASATDSVKNWIRSGLELARLR
jgi:CelD/BcsL family acetyltransferase involved in cellulose biosynthesis